MSASDASDEQEPEAASAAAGDEHEFLASEQTRPDPTVYAGKAAADPRRQTIEDDDESVQEDSGEPDPGELNEPDEPEGGPPRDAAPVATTIPAPRVAHRGPRPGLDGVGVTAMIVFVLIGGLLVFGFAQALVPAAEAQLGAACRPLTPESRSGAAPALELEDLDGNPVSLDEFRGKFLVVNFWATWCEPCTREWPDLDVLGARMAEREDVAVIAISVDQDREAIGPYLERMGLGETPVTILRAKDADAHKLFGSEKIPDTYFVSPSGELEAVFVNVREWGRAKGVRCVEASADRF